MNSFARLRSGWTWKPLEIAALVVAFIIHWVLGLAVLAWKLWNDRQTSPVDLEAGFAEAATRMRRGVDRVFGGSSSPVTADDLTPTGDPAFDGHVRETLAKIDADRRALADELRAFRAFLAEERARESGAYERFKGRHAQSF